MASRKPEIKAFFDEATFTVSYVVWDAETHDAAIIDPVLDYEPRGGRIATRSADKILAFLAEERLRLSGILETHAHADHLSAASHIKAKSGARIGIGDHIGQVQKTFRALFNAKDVSETGAEFDDLFADGTKIPLGGLTIEVMYTPGHTPACVSYRIGDAVFVGDTLFMPDYGTARADFPGGDAEALYRSIRRILSLPPETRLFMCHDYKAEGRDFFAWETTVGAEREKNIHIHDGVDEAAFLAMRKARDATLAPEDEEIGGLMGLHRSIGITILILAILRLLWRVVDRPPPWPATMASYERVIASASHLIFYALLFALPITGWLLSSAEGDPVRYFDLFELPSLSARAGEETFEELHETLFNVLLAFAALHVAGALKHHLWNRDNVLRSMLPGRGAPFR